MYEKLQNSFAGSISQDFKLHATHNNCLIVAKKLNIFDSEYRYVLFALGIN